MKKRTGTCFAVLCLFSILLPGAFSLWPQSTEATETAGGVYAVSEGNRRVRLMWFPPVGQWPEGGWWVTDQGGKTLIKRVKAGDKKVLRKLSKQTVADIRDFIRSLSEPGVRADDKKTPASPEEISQRYGMLGLMIISEPRLARAMGLSVVLYKPKKGLRSYRVIALDAKGNPSTLVMKSNTVDGAIATPLPPQPMDFRAVAGLRGTGLYWSPVKTFPPVVAYAISRLDEQGENPVGLTDSPLILGVKWDSERPAFVDLEAPEEQESRYEIRSVDVFNRKGPARSMRFFRQSLRALRAPEKMKAETQAGGVVLGWQRNPSRYTALYVVERSYLPKGPFLPLTPEGLPADTTVLQDLEVQAGTRYYYRVRSVDPRGKMGEPSKVVTALTAGAGKPAQVMGLKAETGHSRIRLSWLEPQEAVAGFLVEKRSAKGKWGRINPKIIQDLYYDHYFGAGNSGSFSYRVTAVGFDNLSADPVQLTAIVEPRQVLPPAPRITAVSGAAGQAVIRFKAAGLRGVAAQFILIRSRIPEEPGLVMGEPVTGKTRSFTDTFVAAGKQYWYRVVMLDKNGMSSKPSKAVLVTIGNPLIPTPPPPVLTQVKKPFEHVKILFKQPPEGMYVIVERRRASEKIWVLILGPLTGNQALDAKPLRGKIGYRIIYCTASGIKGSASTENKLNL
jgi:hypothetical protein